MLTRNFAYYAMQHYPQCFLMPIMPKIMLAYDWDMPRLNIIIIITNEGSPVLLLDGDISPNYETSFTEDGPPVSLVNVNSLSLTDQDLNPSNYTVFVTLLDPLQGDEERVDIVGEFPLLQINCSQPHNLFITGNTNIIDIEDALRNVVYNNTAEELNGTYRIVEFVDDNYRGQQLRSNLVMTHNIYSSERST